MEVTLLSTEELEDRTTILEKVGIDCDYAYWTRTSHIYYDDCNIYESYVTPLGALNFCSFVYRSHGVRPVLKSDNLEELIKNLKITYKNGVEVVEYGQYPDLKTRFNIPNNASLKPTGKKYYYYHYRIDIGMFNLQELQEYLEYEYNGEKYVNNVNMGNVFFKVKPVKFYVDRENSMLISKDILFDAPINIDNPNYNGKFETSQLYQFLNNKFIKSLKPDKKYTNDDIETLFEEENPYNLVEDVEEENPYNLVEDVEEENVQKVREILKKLGLEFLEVFDTMWAIGIEERLEIIASLRKKGRKI